MYVVCIVCIGTYVHVGVCMIMYLYRNRRQRSYNVGELLVLLWFFPRATSIWGMVVRSLFSALAV